MRSLRLLLSLLAISAAVACGTVTPNTDGGADDATTHDGGETPDDAGADAPEDGRRPDPDASIDAPDPIDLCAAVCGAVDACFGGEGGECSAECGAETEDCTAGERAAIVECAELDCETMLGCFQEVPCLGGPAPVCGDESCTGSETCESCPGDCGACPDPFCGDGVCNGAETCETCPGDCGACPAVCGDGICALGECASCGSDCPNGCSCPHDTCTLGVLLDPGCGTCEAQICAADPYCCTNNWDGICLGESESICGLDCPAVCGDNFCDPLENSTSCVNDCPPPPT